LAGGYMPRFFGGRTIMKRTISEAGQAVAAAGDVVIVLWEARPYQAEFAADGSEFLGCEVKPRTVRKSKLLNERGYSPCRDRAERLQGMWWPGITAATGASTVR
jgi:hypothetical protein